MMKKLLCTLLFTVLSFGLVQAQAEINVQGNTIDIPDGDTTPIVADGTDFGQVNISSSSSEQLFVIQNTGSAPLSITTTLTTNPAFAITTIPASSVAAGNSTTIGITFNAPGTAGITTAQVFIFNGDSDENPYDFTLRGEAIAPTGPEINVTGNSISIVGNGTNTPNTSDGTSFGSVASGTSSAEQIFVIQNLGTTPLSINNGATNTTNPAFAITTAPASTVAASGQTTIGITFNAPPTPGVVNALLFITNGDSDENPYQINLSATSAGPPNPEINVTGNGLNIIGNGTNTPNLSDGTDFGQVNVSTSSTEQLFIIQNTGTSPLSINVPATVTTNPTFAITTAPASSVAAAGQTTIGITFNAPASAGAITASLFITNGDSDENPYQINLRAEAVVPTNPEINITGNGNSIVGDGTNTPSASDGTDFGQVNVSTSSTEQIFIIQNTGSSPLTVNPSITTNPAFAITTAAVSPIPASGQTTIGITFNAPATPQVINAQLNIFNSDSDENPYRINLRGESITPAGPEMDMLDNSNAALASGGSVNFGTTDVSTGSVTHTFTIQNNGNQPLNLTNPSPYVSITGANAADFSLATIPTSPIAASGSTTFQITFDPSALGVRNASVSIANNDADENPYTFSIQGEGIDAASGSPLLITQYYEGTGNSKWIEVKNISTSSVANGAYYLALYTDLDTRASVISTTAPNQSVAIGALAPGEVRVFKNTGTIAPVAPNLGSASMVTSAVCSFDGNDVILISTSIDAANCYNNRIDIMGVVGAGSPPTWGADTSFIKGCGTTEAPSTTFNASQYIELTLNEVNTANATTNIALGTQTVGPTIWTGSWSNAIPDKTKNAIINGSYTSANGSFDSCDLVVNASGSINLNSGTTNYVGVGNNLTINGSVTIGDTESLYIEKELAVITGSITKLERSTALNNFRDFTYWSSPVEGAAISSVFTGVIANRIFTWNPPASGSDGEWAVASGSMTAAKGYISEAPASTPNGGTHSISFTGKPNNGVISIGVGLNPLNTEQGGGYNLIGNPYPASIDIEKFLTDPISGNDNTLANSSVDGTVYFWTHNTQISGGTTGDFISDDYASYNLSGGTASASGSPQPTKNVGSGQGFFVRAKSAGSVNFRNAMILRNQNDQFFSIGEEDDIIAKSINTSSSIRDRIWLDMTSEQGAFNQLLIGFFNKATDGFDRGYDGLKFNGGNHISFYSKIDEDAYAIQGLGSFSQDKKINLGFNTTIKRTFKISIAKIEGALQNENIYLYDKELNIVHDLKASDYEFEITEVGSYSDRFVLQFNKSVLGVEELGKEAANFLVINQDERLHIKSNQDIIDIKVYDMLGRLLLEQKPNKSNFDLNANFKDGTVLIINATLRNGAEISKKAIKH